MPPGNDELDHEIGDLVVRLVDAARQHFLHALAEMDLTPAQGFALYNLKEPLPMRELAAQLGYDASHITGIVDKLEARGLVERTIDPRDRRVKLLVTTPEGTSLRREIDARVIDRQPFLDRLTTGQREQLRDLLALAVGVGPEPEP